MYSWEIQNFLKEKNYQIGGDDLLKIISIKENPQLTHIKYNPFNNSYEIWDKEGNYFYFYAIPFKQEKNKFEKIKK